VCFSHSTVKVRSILFCQFSVCLETFVVSEYGNHISSSLASRYNSALALKSLFVSTEVAVDQISQRYLEMELDQ
jgi:hypothetical protein